MKRLSVLALSLLCSAAPGAANTAACHATAPAFAPAVVELFTSEGCDSCPPADRWLSGIQSEAVLPLAFHVTYWDALGWRDALAQKAFDVRHNDRSYHGGGRTVYTPQVFVDGSNWREWRGDAGGQRLADAASKRQAKATLVMQWQRQPDAVEVELRGRLAAGEAGAINVALVESGLASEVTAGENRGRRLQHDHVVRSLVAPASIAAGHEYVHAVRLPLPSKANVAQLRLVAWIESAREHRTQAALSAALLCP